MAEMMQKKLHILSERTHFRNPSINVLMKITVLDELDKQKFEASLKALQEIHPLLYSTVVLDSDGEAYYQEETIESIYTTIYSEAEEDYWLRIAEQEAHYCFDLTQDSLARFFLFPRNKEFDILIVAHHLLGDGLSIANLLRDIIMTYAGTDIPIRDQELIKGTEDFPKDTKMGLVTNLLIRNWNKSWLKDSRVYSQSEYNDLANTYNQNNHTKLIIKIFSPEDLSNLKSKCSQHTVTINDALVTAMILAQQRFLPKKSGKTQTFAIPISIRNRLPFNAEQSLGNFASAITIKYEEKANQSFWENVQMVHEIIRKKISSEKKVWLLLNLYSSMNGNLIDSLYFASYGIENRATAHRVASMLGLKSEKKNTGISNLGKLKIKNRYNRILIKDLYFFPPVVPNSEITLGIATLGTTMTFGFSYNSDIITYEDINNITNYCFDLLV